MLFPSTCQDGLGVLPVYSEIGQLERLSRWRDCLCGTLERMGGVVVSEY